MDGESHDPTPGLHQLKAAVCRVCHPDFPDTSIGTGFTVAPTLVMTCAHVLTRRDLTAVGTRVGLRFADMTTDVIALVEHVDARDQVDVALLRLVTPRPNAVPLRLASHPPRIGAPFHSYGFPEVALGGLPISGDIADVDPAAHGRIMIRAPMLHGEHLQGFSGSPIVVGGVVVGHLVSGLVDAPDTGTAHGPRHRGLGAYGMIYVNSAAVARAPLGEEADWQAPRTPHHDEVAVAAEIGPRYVLEAFDRIPRDHPDFAGLAQTCVNMLLSHGAPGALDGAARILDALGERDARSQELRALWMIRSRVDTTEQRPQLVLARLHHAKNLSPDGQGVLAGIYKRRYLASGDVAQLRQSHELYAEAFRVERNPYVGINAAATAMWLERRGDGLGGVTELVADVHRCLERIPARIRSHWDLAIHAEATLLLGEVETAGRLYGDAVRKADRRMQDRAVMRRQARQHLRVLGRPHDALDAVFGIPRVAAFTGHMFDRDRTAPRFPEGQRPKAVAALRQVMAEWSVRFGLSQAADGGDMLFLEVLQERQGEARVVLPFPLANFLQTSVSEHHRHAVRALLRYPDLECIEIAERLPDSEPLQQQAYHECNREILARARAHAKQLDDEPILIAIWDGEPGGVGGAGSVVDMWQREGLTVVVIDPPTWQPTVLRPGDIYR